MRHVLGIAGVCAAAILLIVSAAMNWRFGYSLGKSEFESQLYGAASAAADCFKALLPFFIVAALRNRSWSQAVGGVLLFAVCFSYSLTSSLGFSADNRADTTGARTLHAERYQDLRGELGRVRESLSGLPKHRPPGAVQGEIDAIKQNARWLSTGECGNATSARSMSYCEGYHKLRAELGAAVQAEKLEQRAAIIRAKLGDVHGASVAKEVDAQSALLASLSGVKAEQIQTALTILIALLVEIGASIGFYVAFSYWRIFDGQYPAAANPVIAAAPAALVPASPQRAPDAEVFEIPQAALPKRDVELFFEERVAREDGSSVKTSELYDEYFSWCEVNSKQCLVQPMFFRQFNELGIQKAKIAGYMRYTGIRMVYGEEYETPKKLSAIS